MATNYKCHYGLRIKISPKGDDKCVDPIIYNHYNDMATFMNHIEELKRFFNSRKWSVIPEIKLVIITANKSGSDNKIDNGWEKIESLEYR